MCHLQFLIFREYTKPRLGKLINSHAPNLTSLLPAHLCLLLGKLLGVQPPPTAPVTHLPPSSRLSWRPPHSSLNNKDKSQC